MSATMIEKMTAIEEVDKELETRSDEINTLDANRQQALSSFDSDLAREQAEFETATKRRDEDPADRHTPRGVSPSGQFVRCALCRLAHHADVRRHPDCDR